MNNTNKLIVPSYQENTRLALIMLPFLFIATWFLFHIIDIQSFFGSSFFRFVVNFLIKGFLLCGMAIFAFAIVYGLFFMDNKTPAAILDEKTWFNSLG